MAHNQWHPSAKQIRRQQEQEKIHQEYLKRLNREQFKKKLKIWSIIAVISLLVIGGFYWLIRASMSTSAYPYVVGKPGPGDKAPEFSLESTTGGTISLAGYRGKTVLIFYQEGLMCQACWRQHTELERDTEKFKKELGIDHIINITLDPIGSLIQKARTDGYKLPILSDRDAKIALAYDALKYGMMNGANPGHSFILIGPDGVIKWRADYGGPPKYTMYLPDDQVIADMKKDLGKK